jgi:hypothetical protein
MRLDTFICAAESSTAAKTGKQNQAYISLDTPEQADKKQQLRYLNANIGARAAMIFGWL